MFSSLMWTGRGIPYLMPGESCYLRVSTAADKKDITNGELVTYLALLEATSSPVWHKAVIMMDKDRIFAETTTYRVDGTAGVVKTSQLSVAPERITVANFTSVNLVKVDNQLSVGTKLAIYGVRR